MSEQQEVSAEVGTRQLAAQLIRERTQARELLDRLWSELPADVVIGLPTDLIEACRDNHELVWHADDRHA